MCRQRDAGYQQGAEGHQDCLADKRPDHPDREQGRPEWRPGQLVDGDEPGGQSSVADGQVIAVHQHGQQGARGVVGEHLGQRNPTPSRVGAMISPTRRTRPR